MVFTFAVSIAKSFSSPVFIGPVGWVGVAESSLLQDTIDKRTAVKQILNSVVIVFMIVSF